MAARDSHALMPAALSAILSTGLLAGLLCWHGCGDLPEDDPGAFLERATLVALLEPSQPGDLSMAVNDSTTFLPGAVITLRRVGDNQQVTLDEDPAGFRYVFDRALFPLAAGDSVELTLQGTWRDEPISGSAATSIVSAAGLAFTRKPNDRSHGYDADTLMVYNPDIELNLSNPNAFMVDVDESGDDRPYWYQLEFLTVVFDSLSGQWVRTPADRLHWLRDDEADAWQVAPYPDLRFPPGRDINRQMVSWGFFVFVDERDEYVSDVLRHRRMGYYQVTLRRINKPAERFFFTTHMWIRAQPNDPIEFNLEGERCQGVVASCARTSFRIAIVDDNAR
jgi:hypothetical protein